MIACVLVGLACLSVGACLGVLVMGLLWAAKLPAPFDEWRE